MIIINGDGAVQKSSSIVIIIIYYYHYHSYYYHYYYYSTTVPGEPASDADLRPYVCFVWAPLNADLLSEQRGHERNLLV